MDAGAVAGPLQGVVVAVTGAGGFFGPYLLQELLRRGVRIIRALDIVRTKALEDIAASSQGRVEIHVVDLCAPPEKLETALQGVEVVFHCAAFIGYLQRHDRVEPETARKVWKCNVDATKALLESASHYRVKAFVHMSSVGAIFTGFKDHADSIKEDDLNPSPDEFREAYGPSKSAAEKIVLAADKSRSSANTFHTGAIRVSGIWGPACYGGKFIERLIRLHAPVGCIFERLTCASGGPAVTDWANVRNVADALSLVAEHLLQGDASVQGEVFHIHDGVEADMFDHFSFIREATGIPHYHIVSIPAPLLISIAKVWEFAYWLFKIKLGLWFPFPGLTEVEARIGATRHVLCIEKARARLGYKPRSLEELAPPLLKHLAEDWRPKHGVPAVGLLGFSALSGCLLLTALTALDSRRCGTELPWQAVRGFLSLADPSGRLQAMGVAEFQNEVLYRGLFMPMCFVHLAEGVLAAYLSYRAGSFGWPLWGFKTCLFGAAQLRHLPSFTTGFRRLVLLGVTGAFVARPLQCLAASGRSQ